MSIEVLFFIIFAGGWLAGRGAERLRLPAVLGYTLLGIGLVLVPATVGKAGGVALWPAGFADLVPFIKSLALVIILLRAGLGISLAELKQAGFAALLMTFVPCIIEGLTVAALCMAFLGWSWEVAGLTGFMLAAVSPAVVVPSMLDLKSRGLGLRHGVITVILAGASADDVFAITFFTVCLGLATAAPGSSALQSVAWLPVSLLGGLAIGLAAGFALAWWFRRRHGAIRATEKAVLLLAAAVFLVQVGNWLHLAALLGVMGAGFVLLERAPLQAGELAAKLGKIWIPAQIILFVIIGMSLDLSALVETGPLALLIIFLGLIARSLGVLLATIPSPMDWRERWFCVIAYLPKATVQAALGGVALSAGLPEGKAILAIAVLAIVLTAPMGMVGIRLAAPRLLRLEDQG